MCIRDRIIDMYSQVKELKVKSHLFTLLLIHLVSCGKPTQFLQNSEVTKIERPSNTFAKEKQSSIPENNLSFKISSTASAIAFKPEVDGTNKLFEISKDGIVTEILQKNVRIKSINQLRSGVGVEYIELDDKENIKSYGYNLYFDNGEFYENKRLPMDLNQSFKAIYESENGNIVFSDYTYFDIKSKTSKKINIALPHTESFGIRGNLLILHNSIVQFDFVFDLENNKIWPTNKYSPTVYLGNNMYLTRTLPPKIEDSTCILFNSLTGGESKCTNENHKFIFNKTFGNNKQIYFLNHQSSNNMNAEVEFLSLIHI